MRRVGSLLALAVLTAGLLVAPAAAQAEGVLDTAASHLRSDPVYVDPAAERTIDEGAASELRRRIRDSGSAIFLAVLPASAVGEAGGDASRLPQELGTRTGLAGTYGVVAGNSFRGGSTVLPSGRAGSLATAAFQAHSSEGTAAVLADFVSRVAEVQAGQGSPSAGPGPLDNPGDDGSGDGGGGGGGSSVLPVLLLVGAGGGLWYWSRQKRTRQRAEAQQSRSVLDAQLAVLADDVLTLDPLVSIHPDARPDYDAAVSRYRVAQAALEHRDDPIDLVKVGRVLDEGEYAMSRAKAIVEGREPPPPPADLTRPGRRGEPPVDLDDDGRPAYVGYGGSPFYGGGWFGGGSGLLTGLFLGQMLGGGWGWGGHDTNVYVDNSGGDGDIGGGDVGGDFGGGGDWGGGDIGGGDWGGGDIGGGDW